MLGDETSATAVGRVYERVDDTGNSVEHWQHERGCRAWLIVTRDPSTARVLEIRPLAPIDSAT